MKRISLFLLVLTISLAAGAKKQNSNIPIGDWKIDAAGLPCFNYVGSVPYKATLANGDSVKVNPDPWFVLGNYQLTLFAHVSGQYPAGLATDKDPDHYFDMVAWHPYLLTGMNPMIVSETYPSQGRFYREEHIGTLWQNYNDMAYNVMVMNGDADKKVLFTEMGFNDWHHPDKEQAHLAEFEKMFTMISETMPYVKTVHVFRLLTAPAEYQFGLFWHGMKEYNDWLSKSNFKDMVAPYAEVYPDFTPRDKAYAIQKMTGGTKPLELPKEIRNRIQ